MNSEEYTHWTDEGEPVQMSSIYLERNANRVYRYGNRMAPDVIVYVMRGSVVVEYTPTGIMRRFDDIDDAFAFAGKRSRHVKWHRGV